MGLFNFTNKNKNKETPTNKGNDLSFSLSYDYGNRDLSKPCIEERFYGGGGYIPFGEDNLYPQLIDSLYVSSSAHSSIVNFKLNSIVGGGFDFKDIDKVSNEEYKEIKKFIYTNNLHDLTEKVVKDFINSGRCYILLTYSKEKKKYVKSRHISSSSIRNDRRELFKDIEKYFHSEDWKYIESLKEISPYYPGCQEKYQIIELSNHVSGVKSYGLPDWIGAANWVFTDTDLAYLNKQNLINLVDPGAIINFPYEPTPQGQQKINNMLSSNSGSKHYKRKWVFFNDGKDSSPEVTFPNPTNDTGSFKDTDQMMKENISIAHQVNPILIGVQYAGKLGATNEIEMAWDLFKQNWLIRNKSKLEEFFNMYCSIMGINHTFYFKEYSIIQNLNEDTEESSKDLMNIIEKMDPKLAEKTMDTLTINEKRKMVGLKPLVGGNIISDVNIDKNNNEE